jgi:mannose-6-phosphate isomerase-like protein (cupin superfamily)
MQLLNRSALPNSRTAACFEGHHFGDVAVSFFLSDSPPGHGPALHRHPYAEVFIVEEGELTFTVGTDEVVATAGQIVVVPPDTPHKFVNAGDRPARHIDIHAGARMETEWLEDDERNATRPDFVTGEST